VKTVQVRRFGSVPGMGTFGQLTVFDGSDILFTCRTVEREWFGNLPSESCIPDGVYTMTLGMYYGGDGVGGRRDYPAYVVNNVPNRDLIKIHIANYAKQLKGCISPGESFGVVDGEWAIISSRDAFDSVMAFLGDEEVGLEVTWGISP